MYEEKTRNIDVMLHLIAFLCVFGLILLYWPFLGQDNTWTHFIGKLQRPDYWEAQFTNYRYAASAAGWLVHAAGLTYYSLIYIWIFIFAAGLYWTACEFVYFCGLPNRYVPIFSVLVAAHGYMGDIYAFSMVFLPYGMAFIGQAMALHALRRWSSPYSEFAASLAVLFTLMSYQPVGLVILFAASLNLLERSRAPNFELRDAFYATKPVLIFIVGTGLFLLVKFFLGPSYGRQVSFQNIYNNIYIYLKYIYDVYLFGNGIFSPIFERLIYGSSVLILFIYALFLLLFKRKIKYIVTFLSILAAILIIPCPFALFPPGFWPAPREMCATAFFEVGAAAFLVAHFSPTQRGALVLSILLAFGSMFHQVRLFTFLRRQDAHDRLAVQLIVHDIKKITTITPSTKLAVHSTSRTRVQMPKALSAFGATWSNETIFRVLTGDFTPAKLPAGACSEPVKNYWKVKKVGDIVVVCMK